MIPPNTSSDTTENADAAEPSADAGLTALVVRLAGEFSVDAATLHCVATVFEETRQRAPDIFVPTTAALAAAFADLAGTEDADAAPLYAALGEWALDAEGEPIERMRADCLRFQGAMTRGALRIHADNAAQCEAHLLALQRYTLLQVALLASLAARSQGEGGVVRTLPTPEYAAFMEIFRATIEAHRTEGKQLGLLVIHIAKIEQVDRLLGLQKGEAFMLRVTRRLREGVLRKQDRLGRISRDQFACLLPRIAGEGVAILAASKILGALGMPIPIGGQSFDTDAVIGIAVYPEHGDDQQTLVRNAKLATGTARGAAERFAVYEATQGASEERNMQYEMRLRLALEQSQLTLGFAPQLDLRANRIAGLGCTLCWSDAELGEVAATRTMEAAESSGLTREVTWWLFNNALRQYAEFAQAGITLPLALKLTAGGLAQPDIAEFVDRALRTWKVAPQRVTLEVHESALAAGMAHLKETLTQLKGFGVRLCIDGFGTSSCSLASLAQLPFDEVKIGATFVGDNPEGLFHIKIVRSLAHLAQDLEFAVTSEGVKDEITALALSTIGCERVQGDYVGRALSAQEVLACKFDTALQLPLAPGA